MPGGSLPCAERRVFQAGETGVSGYPKAVILGNKAWF